MDQPANVPRVAFMINLGPTEPTESHGARVHHLVHLFRGHRLPATWAVSDAERAHQLQAKQIPAEVDELALAVNANWCSTQTSKSRFRNELTKRLASLQAARAAATTLVVGKAPILRSRAAILAEQGIRAILNASIERSVEAKSRPLPCGLWQLVPNVQVPQVRRLPLWWPLLRTSARQLVAAGGTSIVAVQSNQLGRSSARSLQQIERLLREVAWAASRNQLALVTVGQIVTELTSAREVKPQRSILRLAA